MHVCTHAYIYIYMHSCNYAYNMHICTNARTHNMHTYQINIYTHDHADIYLAMLSHRDGLGTRWW